jgi:hypothetical protein
MTVFHPDRRPQPLQLWQGVLCRIAKVGANRPAKVQPQIAKVALHSCKARCAEVQTKLCERAMVVLPIGKPASVFSMSVIGSLFKECHQGVSSSKSPCLPATEGNR